MVFMGMVFMGMVFVLFGVHDDLHGAVWGRDSPFDHFPPFFGIMCFNKFAFGVFLERMFHHIGNL